MENRTAPPRHIPALDGLRGLAIILVVLKHWGGGAKSNNLLVHRIGVASNLGWVGVPLFFVLSGYLIGGIVWRQKEQQGWVRRFYLRRTLRIFPLYYFALLLVLLSTFALHTTGAALPRILVYVAYLQNYSGLPSELLGLSWFPVYHLWTLAIEEQFYVVWPFLLSRARTPKQAVWLCVCAYILSAVWRFATWQGVYSQATIGRIGEFAVGSLLAIVVAEYPVWTAWLTRRSVTLFAVAMAVFAMSIYRDPRGSTLAWWSYTVGLCALPWAAVALILRTSVPGIGQRLFSGRVIRYVGRRSYGIYVYHVLLYPVTLLIATWLAAHIRGMNSPMLLRPVAVVVTLLAAEISYRLLESPFLRLKERFEPQKKVAAEAVRVGRPSSSLG